MADLQKITDALIEQLLYCDSRTECNNHIYQALLDATACSEKTERHVSDVTSQTMENAPRDGTDIRVRTTLGNYHIVRWSKRDNAFGVTSTLDESRCPNICGTNYIEWWAL